jgi:hypothetical protein
MIGNLTFGQPVNKPNGIYYNNIIGFSFYGESEFYRFTIPDLNSITFKILRWDNDSIFECVIDNSTNNNIFKYKIISFDGINLVLYEYTSPIDNTNNTYKLEYTSYWPD